MLKIDVYTTRFCPFCVSAKRLLKKKGVRFNEIDVTTDPGGRMAMSKRAGGRTTVPQIFIGARHVGGCDDLMELDMEGRLDGLLRNGG